MRRASRGRLSTARSLTAHSAAADLREGPRQVGVSVRTEIKPTTRLKPMVPVSSIRPFLASPAVRNWQDDKLFGVPVQEVTAE